MGAPAAGQKVRAADFDGGGTDFEATNDTTTGTSYGGGTAHGTPFTAPTSGAVKIGFGGLLGSNHTVITAASYMSIHVRNGAVVGSGTDFLAASDGNALRYYKPFTAATFHYCQVFGEIIVTGLSPNVDYNVVTEYRAVGGTAGVAARRITVEPAFI